MDPSVEPPGSRRQFLQRAAGGIVWANTSLGMTALTPWFDATSFAQAKPALDQTAETKDHFFIHCIFDGGWDTSYLFDARPLELTDKGLWQNHLYKSAEGDPLPDPTPTRFDDDRGGWTLVSPLARQFFKDHRQQFTLMNGVYMLPSSFLGHGNNMYYLLCGKAVNGASFAPVLGMEHGTLDNLHLGPWSGDLNRAPTNFQRSVQFSNDQLRQGISLQQLVSQGAFVGESPLGRMLLATTAANTDGSYYGLANQQLHQLWQRVPELQATFEDAAPQPQGPWNNSVLGQKLELAKACFQAQVTRSITIMMGYDGNLPLPDGGNTTLDCHSGSIAAQHRTSYGILIRDLEDIMRFLREVPYDDQRSMADVTTLLVSSEFGRTNRQIFTDVERSGSDHNPYSNSLLVAGKGIRTGMILGASDLDSVTAEGSFAGVSPAHQAKEAALGTPKGNYLFPMGRPFNVSTMQVDRQRLPDSFQAQDYLSVLSVTNTLMSHLGVPKERFFTTDSQPRSTNYAPIMKGLLQS